MDEAALPSTPPPLPISALDPGGHLAAAAGDCVHCGFCLPACPTYQLWGEEMDSPRGRIHLISQALQGSQLTEAATSHLDRCLGCMACLPACPSGVRYDRLIEAARSWTEEPPPGLAPGPVRGRLADRRRQELEEIQRWPLGRQQRRKSAATRRIGDDDLGFRTGEHRSRPLHRRRERGRPLLSRRRDSCLAGRDVKGRCRVRELCRQS